MNHPGKIPEWYKEKLKGKFNPWKLLFLLLKVILNAIIFVIASICLSDKLGVRTMIRIAVNLDPKTKTNAIMANTAYLLLSKEFKNSKSTLPSVRIYL